MQHLQTPSLSLSLSPSFFISFAVHVNVIISLTIGQHKSKHPFDVVSPCRTLFQPIQMASICLMWPSLVALIKFWIEFLVSVWMNDDARQVREDPYVGYIHFVSLLFMIYACKVSFEADQYSFIIIHYYTYYIKNQNHPQSF